jgi:hypothetical protein
MSSSGSGSGWNSLAAALDVMGRSGVVVYVFKHVCPVSQLSYPPSLELSLLLLLYHLIFRFHYVSLYFNSACMCSVVCSQLFWYVTSLVECCFFAKPESHCRVFRHTNENVVCFPTMYFVFFDTNI